MNVLNVMGTGYFGQVTYSNLHILFGSCICSGPFIEIFLRGSENAIMRVAERSIDINI